MKRNYLAGAIALGRLSWLSVILLLLIPPKEVSAQKNIAPAATVTATGTGAAGCQTGACSAFNDLNFGTCGTQLVWISTSTPPSSTIGDDYIQFDWSTPRRFNKIVIHHASNADPRFLAGGQIQYWNGSSWVNHFKFSNLPLACSNVISFNTISASRFRITQFVMKGPGQLSNPNFREIEVIEAPGGMNDAGVASTSPVLFCNPGNHNLGALIQNSGLNKLDSVRINWSVDGVLQSPVFHKTAIDTAGSTNGNTATVALGTINLSFSTARNVKIWTSHPNGGTDTIRENDTLKVSLQPSLGGTYTINKTGSGANNFTSFTSAVNALVQSGICGPVVFNVAAGTYTEQIDIPAISGSSATNTITFDGTNAATRTLQFSTGSTTDAHTLRFKGSSFIIVKNLTIKANGAAGIGVHFYSTSTTNDIKVVKCSVIVATTTSANVKGIAATNSNISSTGGGCSGAAGAVYNIYIDSNYISGGNIGVFLSSSSNPAIPHNFYVRWNRLENVYNTGIGASGSNGYLYDGNYIKMSTTLTTSKGIHHCNGSSSGVQSYKIINNIIENAGQYGIHFQSNNSNTNPLYPTLVANNFITPTFTNSTSYGINASQPRNHNIYHNTILMNVANGRGIDLTASAQTPQSNVKNNIVELLHPSSTNVAFYSGAINVNEADYNIFNKNSTDPNPDLVTINGITYQKSNFIKGGGFNENSLTDVTLKYVSNTDLHLDPNTPPFYAVNVGIFTDIDGDPRCLESPTIGADESKYPFPKPTAGFTHADTIFVNSGTDFLNNVDRTAPYRHRWYIDGKLVATTHDINYSFPATGTYTVAVASSGCGAKDSFSKVITIVSPTRKPVANFSVDRNVIPKGDVVYFKDLSTNGPSSWTWEVTPKEVYDPTMGMVVPAYSYTSSTDSSSQNPVIRFDYAGSYSICFTSANSFGSSSVCKIRYVRVKESIELCNVSETVSNKNFGTITDNGGATANYSNNLKCNFLISPCSPTLGLKIKSFNLEANYDFLRLYDGSDNTAPKLYDTKAFPNGLTGNAATIPGFPDTIMSKSGKIYIEFTSDPATVAAGFEMEWFADSFNMTPPVADFSVPDTICYGLDVLFKNQSKGYGNMYFWDVDGDSIIDYTDENPVELFVNTGAHQIMLIAENCGGRDTIVKNVFVVNPLTGPKPEFTADITGPNAITDIVTFSDKSFRCVDSWRWEFSPADVSFVNGTNASSQNPQVKFGSAGCYDVKLVAGFNGVEDSITKTCYINALKYCTPVVSTLTSDIGISGVTIGNMSNGSPVAEVAYTDYTATKSVTLIKRVPVSFNIRRQTSFNAMSVAIWIDMNQNGTFESSERVAFENALSGTSWNSSFTIPGTAKTGGTRLRIGTNLTNLPNLPCGTNRNGEFEDYRVFITEDNVAPVITMKGMDTVRIEQGTLYIDSGAVATDDLDGDITSKIVVTNPVNVQLLGLYRVRYNVSDSAGNKAAQVTRIVIVMPDTTAPVITLTGGDTVYVEVGTGTYAEPGYTAIDPGNNMDITTDVVVSGSVDVTKVGTYIITYAVQDEAGNPATKLRTVIVRDTVKPVITLKGSDTVYHQVYTSYIDSGVTFTDNYWNTLALTVSSNVDTSKLGVYTIVYSVRDSSGNVATASRTVIVIDTVKPVITLNGPDTLQVEVFSQYFELGATVTDNFSQNLRVVITGTVDVTKLGFYPITYSAVDENGNVADSVTRIVHVVDTKAPVITLIGNRIVNLSRGATYTDSGYTVTDNYWAASGIKVDTTTNFKGDGTDEEGGYFIRYTATDGSGNVSFVERLISVGVNGVDETTALQGSVNIFPNPAANGTFSIDVNLERAENVKVCIFNMLGQEIRTLHNGNLSSQRFNVEISEKAGMYLVRIQTANGAITKPVILTK